MSQLSYSRANAKIRRCRACSPRAWHRSVPCASARWHVFQLPRHSPCIVLQFHPNHQEPTLLLLYSTEPGSLVLPARRAWGADDQCYAISVSEGALPPHRQITTLADTGPAATSTRWLLLTSEPSCVWRSITAAISASLLGKYWYNEPILTPATSAILLVLAWSYPSFTKMRAVASRSASTVERDRS